MKSVNHSYFRGVKLYQGDFVSCCWLWLVSLYHSVHVGEKTASVIRLCARKLCGRSSYCLSFAAACSVTRFAMLDSSRMTYLEIISREGRESSNKKFIVLYKMYWDFSDLLYVVRLRIDISRSISVYFTA